MLEQDLNIPAQDVRRLLAAACPDAALLYLYLHTGGEPEKAAQALRFTARQMDYGGEPAPDGAVSRAGCRTRSCLRTACLHRARHCARI